MWVLVFFLILLVFFCVCLSVVCMLLVMFCFRCGSVGVVVLIFLISVIRCWVLLKFLWVRFCLVVISVYGSRLVSVFFIDVLFGVLLCSVR